MSKRTLKNIIMGVVIVAALVLSVLSYSQNETLSCIGYILTALIPVSIWFLDERENQERDERILKLNDTIESYGLKVVDNPEYVYAIVDAEEKFLFGIKRNDGSIEWGAGVPGPIREELNALKKRIAELEKK